MTERDNKIDEILEEWSRNSPRIEPALTEQIAAAIRPSLLPVRPLPATWKLATGLFLVCAAVAIAGAVRVGLFGFEKMDLVDRALMFTALTVLVGAAAVEFTNEMIPGSRLRLTPFALLGTTSAALLVIFALLFRDHTIEHFFSAGIVCLVTGVLHAVPAALIGWWVLRRGFAVNAAGAGLCAGMLGGLAGVAMLELHCPNFEAAHVLVWHTAVVPLSAIVGAMVAGALSLRTSSGTS